MILFIQELIIYLRKRGVHFNSEGFPIFENWMMLKELPRFILPFNHRNSIFDNKSIVLCFFIKDHLLYPKLNALESVLLVAKDYMGICGFDITVYYDDVKPYAEMQILLNACVTAFFAINGVKIFPNPRFSNYETKYTLDIYPKDCILTLGSLGFSYKTVNKDLCIEIFKMIFNTFPNALYIIYGPVRKYMMAYLKENNIHYYQYDSFRELCKKYPESFLHLEKINAK